MSPRLIPEKLSGRRLWFLVAAVGLAALVIALAGASVFYRDRALPMTTLAGENVGGQNRTQVLAKLDERVKSTTLTLQTQGVEKVMSLSDLGVTIDNEATVAKVFAANNSFFGRMVNLFSGNKIEPVHDVDDSVFSSGADTISEAAGARGKDANVIFNAEKEHFEVTPAEMGKSIDKHELRSLVEQAVAKLEPIESQLQILDEVPAVSTDMAQAALAEADSYFNLAVKISDGIEVFEPSAADKSKWLNIKAADGRAGVSVDTKQVTQWVQKLGESTNVVAEPGIQNVNSRGDVVATPDPGVKGFTVKNTEQVAKDLVAALSAKADFKGTFDYDETEPTFEKRLIADGGENLAYQAAPGEKWIDINLSDATVSAYEGATIVQGPMYIVPGAPGMETVTGVFNVYLKVPSQTMRGTNLDGTKYETPGVPWILYFHGDYALHGAPWRSSFGWSGPGGSHGCVNMSVSHAQWLYNWAEVGTPVASHY